MSTPVKVRKDRLDWLAECADHGASIWCSDWLMAMEAAYGHVVMHHKAAPSF